MKFALFGSYGRNNLGDEAIADGILKMLKRINPEAEAVLFSHNVENSKKLHREFVAVMPMVATGLRSFWTQWRDGSWKKTLQLLKDCDFIIIGGGGIFHDSEVGQKGLSPLFIWWLRTLLFRWLKKPILLWAIGIGPIASNMSNFFLRGILRRAHVVSVRDQASADLIFTLTNKPITIVPDPVWGLFSSMDHRQTSAALSINIRKNKRLSTEQIGQQLIKIIQDLQSKYTFSEIQFVPFALAEPDDRDVMADMKLTLEKAFSLPISIHTPHSPADAFSLIQNSKAVIAMRFHSYIFAISAERPCVMLSYSSKTDAITQYSLAENLARQKNAQDFWHDILKIKD